MSDKMPDKMPDKMCDNMSDLITDNMYTKMSEKMSVKMSVKMSEKLCIKIKSNIAHKNVPPKDQKIYTTICPSTRNVQMNIYLLFNLKIYK